jgi:predicted nucleic-acid-binding Zn-ribbon protein
MAESDGGFSLQEAIDTAGDAVTEFREFLGVQEEVYTCPDCSAPCKEATVYDPNTVAFNGGECPTWQCPKCGTHYHRESDDARHTVDLYGRE